MKFKKKCILAIIGMMALSTVVMAQGGLGHGWNPFTVCPVCGGQIEYGPSTGDTGDLFSFTCHNENKVYYGFIINDDGFYSTDPIEPVTVTFDVTEYGQNPLENGPAIPGAEVTARDGLRNSVYGITNSNGYVTLTGYPGTWYFTVSADGYLEKTSYEGVGFLTQTWLVELQKKEKQSESVASTTPKRFGATTPQGSENNIVGRWLIRREDGQHVGYCYVDFYSDGTSQEGQWYESPGGALESLQLFLGGSHGSERDWTQYGDKISWRQSGSQLFEGTIIGDRISGFISYSGKRIPFSAERVSV
jgi:hypothetical protein